MNNKIIKSFFIVVASVLFGFLLFKYSWQLFDNKQELTTFSKKIEAVPMIPDSLMTIYYLTFPYHNGISTTHDMLIGLRGFLKFRHVKKYENCFCDDIVRSDLWPNRLKIHAVTKKISSLRLSFALESLVGQRACLNYYLRNEYQYTLRLIQNFPYKWKNKAIESLTKEEFIEYIAVKDVPYAYNKFTNIELFNLRIKVIKEKIDGACL
jgi:hypothetical protein